MNKDRRIALAGSLRGGSIIRTLIGTWRWVDFRGNVYSDEEIAFAKKAGIVQPVEVVVATANDMRLFVEGKPDSEAKEPEKEAGEPVKASEKQTKPQGSSQGNTNKKEPVKGKKGAQK